MLSGDETGWLLGDYILRRSTPGANVRTVASTVVSSRMLSKLAATAGVAYGEALTGFKWVVRTATPEQRFAFGYEEALGYCVGDLVRDKDGVTAALLFADLAARLRADGSSVGARLDELARTHGAHVTRQRSIRVSGSDWLERVSAVMAALRSTPPADLAGRTVVHVEDLALVDRFPVPSDVLVWTLDGARAIVRPSGTEPKLKAYAEAVVPVGDRPVAEARRLALDIVDEVLDGVAVRLGELGL
jgi:phosphomannomutase